MTELKRLLGVTDLSAPARRAMARAALISKETASTLALLHVANLAPLQLLRQLAASPDDLEGRVLDAARQKLQELAAALQQHYGVAISAQVTNGALLDEIARNADAMAAGLLVCGSRGESIIRHTLLGSTATRLLSMSTCPVLVVKQAAHEPYRKLLVPVDFSPTSLRAISHAQAIAPGAAIVLLHAFDVPFEGLLRYANVDGDSISHYRSVAEQEATLKMRALSAQAGLSPHACTTVVLHGDARLRIIEQEQEQDCDLIVMGKHGKSVFEELLLGSVTKHVLAESESDVLVSR